MCACNFRCYEIVPGISYMWYALTYKKRQSGVTGEPCTRVGL